MRRSLIALCLLACTNTPQAPSPKETQASTKTASATIEEKAKSILTIASKAESQETRRILVEALAEIKEPFATEMLAELLFDVSPQVRSWAAAALAHRGDLRGKVLLDEALRGTVGRNEQFQAAKALQYVDATVAASLLEACLLFPDASLAAQCASSLLVLDTKNEEKLLTLVADAKGAEAVAALIPVLPEKTAEAVWQKLLASNNTAAICQLVVSATENTNAIAWLKTLQSSKEPLLQKLSSAALLARDQDADLASAQALLQDLSGKAWLLRLLTHHQKLSAKLMPLVEAALTAQDLGIAFAILEKQDNTALTATVQNQLLQRINNPLLASTPKSAPTPQSQSAPTSQSQSAPASQSQPALSPQEQQAILEAQLAKSVASAFLANASNEDGKRELLALVDWPQPTPGLAAALAQTRLLEILKKALLHPSEPVRAGAVAGLIALSKRGTKDAAEILEALREDVTSIREKILRNRAIFTPEQQKRIATRYLDDPSLSLRVLAAQWILSKAH